jgi:integrase
MFSYVNDPKTTLGWNMAHSVRDPRLQTRAARLRLPSTVRRKNGTIGQADPVYVRVGQGVSLGYRRNKTGGAWVMRAFNGKGGRITRNVGAAEDYAEADGESVLTFDQAAEAARRIAAGRGGPVVVSVSDALAAYAADLEKRGRDAANVARIRRHLTDALAAKPVALVTSREWRRRRDSMPMKPASINRTCRAFRAALNAAADHDQSLDPSPWRIGLASLPDAENSRNVILDEAAVKALVAAAHNDSPEFGLLVETAAQTGARPSQLRRMLVQDLAESTEGPRLSLPVSRKGRGTKPVTHRPVPISAGLAVRLKVAVAGRARTAPLLTRPSGEPWAHSDQKKPFRRIAEAIGQDAGKVTFYALRHSSIVRQLLAGTPVRIVATAHDTSVAMIERTYSRFIADHADALLRAGMFDTEGGKAEGKVVPLLRS